MLKWYCTFYNTFLLMSEVFSNLCSFQHFHFLSVFLDPMVMKLQGFAEFTVGSQVLYYTSLSVKPKKTSGEASFFFPQSSLPHIITPVEAKLGKAQKNSIESSQSLYMGQNFERCTIGHFQTLSTSITPGSPPDTQKPFILVST